MKNMLAKLINAERVHDLDLAVCSKIDWAALIREANVQGVGPLIYWTLSISGKLSLLPIFARNDLRALYTNTWFHNKILLSELGDLACIFGEAAIPIVALKGSDFVVTIYPDIGLRPMSDLDLLIPELEFSRAVKIARSKGYGEIAPEVYPGLRSLLKDEFSLVKRGEHPVALELHNSLLENISFTYAVPSKWFWEQTEPISCPTQKKLENLLVLNPTANVLYLSAHTILKHGPQGSILRQFYDLHQLISVRASSIDWDLMVWQARKFEWGSALSEALSIAHNYFDTPIPATVLTQLPEFRDRHEKYILLMKAKPATRVFEEYTYMLPLKWYGRLIKVLALVFPGPWYMHWRYKPKTVWALPWCYLLRWWGIIKDGVRTLAILVRGR